jgi:hypothetical protein
MFYSLRVHQNGMDDLDRIAGQVKQFCTLCKVNGHFNDLVDNHKACGLVLPESTNIYEGKTLTHVQEGFLQLTVYPDVRYAEK